MSHIKDRLSDYHDFMKKLADDHQMILASGVLEMIEQLQDDLEQDEKENGWIPVSEGLPEASGTYQVTCMDGRIYRSTIEKCSSPIGDGNSYSNLETVTFGNKVNCY